LGVWSKILRKAKLNIPFAHSSCLVTNDSDDMIAREL
jgi:hypothetical protein